MRPHSALRRRTVRPLQRSLGILLVGATLAASPVLAHADEPSPADVESARAAFLQGLEMRDKNHDAKGAVERLKAAFSLVPTPRIGFELGVTYRMLGNLVEARAAFMAVDRLPVRKNESAEAKKARDDARTAADELDARIPELTIRLTGDGQVSVDGEAIRHDALAVPRKLNPGRHVIQVLLDGEAKSQKFVDLREGDKKSIDLETPSAKAAAIPTPPPGGGTTWNPPGTAGWVPPGQHEKPNPARPVAFTIMAVGLGVGAGVGLYSIIAVSTAKKDCDATTNICNSDYAGHKSTAMTLSIVADVFFGVAIVSGIVGLVMPRMVKDDGPEVGFTPLPGGGFLSTGGRF